MAVQAPLRIAAMAGLFCLIISIGNVPASARVLVQIQSTDGSGVPSKIFVYRGGNARPEPPVNSRPDGSYVFDSIQCSAADQIKFSIEPQSRGSYSWSAQVRRCEPTVKFQVRRTVI